MNIKETIIKQRQFFVYLSEEELQKIILEAVAKEAGITDKYTAKLNISSKSSDTRASIPYAEVSIIIDLNISSEIVK